jgi:hypothetical protein
MMPEAATSGIWYVSGYKEIVGFESRDEYLTLTF